MGHSPPLHIVIATHERLALLRQTLNSLAECEQPEAYQGAIVVENGSKAGAKRIVEDHGDTLNAEYLNAEYLYASHAHKSHALNRALEAVGDGLIFFTDDDVRVHPKVLVRYSEAAQGIERGLYFGGPTDVDYEEPPPDWLLPSLPSSAVGWDQDSDWHYALGCNWAAFVEDLRSCGGFDEEKGPGSGTVGSETDMQKRLEESGVEQRFVEGARVWHYIPKERCNPKWLLHRYYRMGKGDAHGGWDVSGRWFGFNSWMWLELGRRVLRKAWTSNREKRFKAKRKLAYFVGKMKGIRESAKQRRQ